jgi:hypothetical protein
MADEFTYAADLLPGVAESLQSSPGIQQSLRRLSGAAREMLIPVDRRSQVQKAQHLDSDVSWQGPEPPYIVRVLGQLKYKSLSRRFSLAFANLLAKLNRGGKA